MINMIKAWLLGEDKIIFYFCISQCLLYVSAIFTLAYLTH